MPAFRPRCPPACAPRSLVGVLHTRNAEIGELGARLRVEHHVGRLDVAVDDAGAVREIERVAQLAHDAHHLLQLKSLVGVEEGLEFLALDELHDEVRDVAFLAEVVDLDNVRMVEPRDRPRFAHEAHRVILGRIFVEVALEDGLDRHPASEARILALVDDAHRALADRALDAVSAQRLQFRRQCGHVQNFAASPCCVLPIILGASTAHKAERRQCDAPA